MWEEYNIRSKRLQGKFRPSESNVTADLADADNSVSHCQKQKNRNQKQQRISQVTRIKSA